jgi:hypothetical protein
MDINYNEVVSVVAGGKVVRATKYISPTLIVRATRTLYRKRIARGNVEILVTVGRPNYLEREFIKACKKSGEPFPVKKVQLKLYNPPGKKLQRRGKEK